MSLYSILLISSITIPFMLSFDKKLQFYKQWKYVLPAIFTIAAVYILCDIYLTQLGVWGFNPRYHSSLLLYKLPIEEWLFFIIIPYASIFLHECLVLFFPEMQLSKNVTQGLSLFLIIVLSIIALLNFEKLYTIYIFSFVILVLVISLLTGNHILRRFYLTFLVILIPFVIVNAILTGSFIESEVVWYNNSQNLGIRFLTIPIEDFGYAFSLILFNLLLVGKLKNLFKTATN